MIAMIIATRARTWTTIPMTAYFDNVGDDTVEMLNDSEAS